MQNGSNGEYYYYVYNYQGDVVALLDSSLNYVANYTYDSWGKLVSVTGSNTAIGNLNPFRYRGYYYDSETGLYYLQSRYYNPEIGRFINADGIVGSNGDVISNNLFAYCDNNPIVYSDLTGLCKSMWNQGIQGPCPGSNSPLCVDNILKTNQEGVQGAVGLITSIHDLSTTISQSLFDHACKYLPYPKNITKATSAYYNKNVKAVIAGPTKVLNALDEVSSVLSVIGVSVEVFQGIDYNTQIGASQTKICWDAAVDTTFLSANLLMSTSVGFAVGSAICPVVGSAIGGFIGLAFGSFTNYVLDSVSEEPRKQVKAWVKY